MVEGLAGDGGRGGEGAIATLEKWGAGESCSKGMKRRYNSLLLVPWA